MKKSALLSIIAISASIIATSPAFAGNTHDPGVNWRQHKQGKRIKQGMHSGALTYKEAVGLGVQQAHIRRTERRFKSDGHLTVGERARLHHKLNKSSRQIYKQKHDGQRR